MSRAGRSRDDPEIKNRYLEGRAKWFGVDKMEI